MTLTSFSHNQVPEYFSTLTGKGSLLPESKLILKRIDEGVDAEAVRSAVIQGEILDRDTFHARKKVWEEVYRRFISGRDPNHVRTLARMVTRCQNEAAADLVLFYEFCQADALLYDLTAYCTYELYQDARTSIDKVDISDWLTRNEAEHPEITGWSPITRNRLLGSYLSAIRDFGLVEGVKRKEFHKLFVPREAFVYALYHQKERGVVGKALIQSLDWRLYLLSQADVIFMLDDASNGGFVRFRRLGDVVDLQYVYESLDEVVDVITD